MPRSVEIKSLNPPFCMLDLAQIVRDITGMSRDDSINVASIIIKVMAREFIEKGHINFRKFCTLRVVSAKNMGMKTWTCRCPSTGKLHACKPKKKQRIKATWYRPFKEELKKL